MVFVILQPVVEAALSFFDGFRRQIISFPRKVAPRPLDPSATQAGAISDLAARKRYSPLKNLLPRLQVVPLFAPLAMTLLYYIDTNVNDKLLFCFRFRVKTAGLRQKNANLTYDYVNFVGGICYIVRKIVCAGKANMVFLHISAKIAPANTGANRSLE
jgi:hypothetical protein